MSKAINVVTFMQAQHACESVSDLANYLGQSEAVVRQRIKKLKEQFGTSKFRPYDDEIKPRGRRKLADSWDDIGTYEWDCKQEQLAIDGINMDNQMRMELAVK